MEFVNSILTFLKKPYPEVESRSKYFITTTLVSLFITFFLFIFQPFGLSSAGSEKFFICLGFGSMTFISFLIYDFTIKKIFKLKERPERYTFGKWMINAAGLMFTISLANFLFSRSLFGTIQWAFFPQMIYATFAIGLFPLFIIGALALLRQERKYQNIAKEINEKKSASPDLVVSDLSLFDIPIDQILYIEALQNYVRIGYLDDAGQVVEQTERATLKSILDDAQGSSIIKCHRSFLVNRTAIVSTSGNAQGLLLSLTNCDKQVPVSRSFVPVFRGD
jgi:hypothetical protein